eukprot:362387-Chlamydomonas_euryale.AAC.4
MALLAGILTGMHVHTTAGCCKSRNHAPAPLLFNGNRHTPLELLVLALVVCVHFMPALLAPHERVVGPALLVVDPHVRAVIAVMVGDVCRIHLLLQSATRFGTKLGLA